MKKLVFLCMCITSVAFGASSSTETPIAEPIINTRTPFDPKLNCLAKSWQILLSYTKQAPLYPTAKKALETACNSILWFASQNDETCINTHKFHQIPYRQGNYAPIASSLQYAWYGYRQVQKARKNKGLVSAEADIAFMVLLETVVKEALSAEPDFESEPKKEALEKLQAYANTYTLKARRPRIASPTKRERATTTRITDFFSAAASGNSKKPRTT